MPARTSAKKVFKMTMDLTKAGTELKGFLFVLNIDFVVVNDEIRNTLSVLYGLCPF